MELELEKTKYIGAFLAVAGFIFLTFLLPQYQTFEISSLEKQNIGQSGNVLGTIRQLEIRAGNAFFTLENRGTIKAVFFDPTQEQLSLLKENSPVKVFGTVSLYKGTLELIVERVQKID